MYMCLNVQTVKRESKRGSPFCNDMCGCFVPKPVTQTSEGINLHLMNNPLIEELENQENQSGFTQLAIESPTQNVYLI